MRGRTRPTRGPARRLLPARAAREEQSGEIEQSWTDRKSMGPRLNAREPARPCPEYSARPPLLGHRLDRRIRHDRRFPRHFIDDPASAARGHAGAAASPATSRLPS